MHQFRLEKFEGPLDLLLGLIEKNQLQITEISLAQVTDQYLGYLKNLESLPAEEVADFLLIASKLIYLKSRYLLPDLDLADEEDVGSLERQLKIYRQYYEASKEVNHLYNTKKRYSLIREVPYRRVLTEKFWPPKHISIEMMTRVFREVLERIERVVKMPQAVLARAISIGDKIRHLRELLSGARRINFHNLVKDRKDKVEVVVSFLAMLELIKQREIVVEQEAIFGDLNIKKI